MYIQTSEMKSVLYKYQMDEITENDIEIVEDAILAATAEVRAYFEAANERRESANLSKQQYKNWKLYDVDAIFSATGTDRNNFIMRIVKTIAAYHVCELANVDVIYEHVKERYDRSIATLEKIAGMGDYANSRIIIPGLPTIDEGQDGDEEEESNTTKPFRMVSRKKFNHE